MNQMEEKQEKMKQQIKIVLAFITFLSRPPPQLIVSNNHWPHHDRGHVVARGWGKGEGENSSGTTTTWTARTARSLRPLDAAATGTAWPARSPRSVGAVAAGTARTARSSLSLGASGALFSLPRRGGDGDGLSRRAPSTPAARRQRLLCSPRKDGGGREKAS